MPTMPMRTDPYARTPAVLSKTGKTFALVLALHVGLFWLAQVFWTSEPLTAVREVVAAQLIQEFRAPEPPKPEPPAPKVPPPQASPVLPSQMPTPVAQAPSALPAITAAPTTPAPASLAAPAPTATARAPVVVAAAARMDSCERPRYPSASERLREEGVVTLKFLIGENGQVLSGSVDKTSGHKRLDDAALAALSLCKFRPATVDGKPKQEWSALRYRWEIND